MSFSDSFRTRAYIYGFGAVAASASAVVIFAISREIPEIDVLRDALAGTLTIGVISLSAFLLRAALSSLFGRFFLRESRTERHVAAIEESALAGLAAGLIGGGLFQGLTMVWLPYVLPPEELFILVPLAAMAIVVFSGQVDFWLRDTQAEQEQAHARLEAVARQLEQEAQVREKFLLTLAHESRTPLTSLRVSAELLRDVGTKNDDPVITRLSQSMGRSAGELASLYANIVDIGHILRHDFSLDPEALSLSEVARVASEAVAPAMAGKKQTLKLTNSAEAVEVLADRQAVNRILVGLLDNASRYSPAESEIDLIVSSDGKDALFEVKDQGEGIAPEEQDQVFKPFYRVQSADSRYGAGIGVGLTVARTLAEAHGGSIRVESAPGRGSSFFVRLPVKGPPEKVEGDSDGDS